jgi:hypothetical protein
VEDVEPLLPRAVIEGGENRVEGVRADMLAQPRQGSAERLRPRQIGEEGLARAEGTFYGITGFAEICRGHG